MPRWLLVLLLGLALIADALEFKLSQDYAASASPPAAISQAPPAGTPGRP